MVGGDRTAGRPRPQNLQNVRVFTETRITCSSSSPSIPPFQTIMSNFILDVMIVIVGWLPPGRRRTHVTRETSKNRKRRQFPAVRIVRFVFASLHFTSDNARLLKRFMRRFHARSVTLPKKRSLPPSVCLSVRDLIPLVSPSIEAESDNNSSAAGRERRRERIQRFSPR